MDVPVSLVDVFPTIIELLGVEGIASRAGYSLLSPVTGANRAILSEARGTDVRTPAIALRKGGWLYHCYEADAMCELCDIERDPICEHNLRWDQPVQARALQQDLGHFLDTYRNDVRYRARRERFFARYAR